MAIYYTLTAEGDGHGSVTLSPIGGNYISGTTVTLTPVPNFGYKFVDWSGDDALDIINTGGVYTIVMDEDKTVYANFAAIPQYTLTTSVTPEDGGSISPSSGTFYEGTVVTLTATHASGFVFSNWAGDLSGSTNPITLTMDDDKIVEAVFAPAQICSTVNLTATEDTYLSAANVQYNNGGTDDLHVDNTTGTSRRASYSIGI